MAASFACVRVRVGSAGAAERAVAEAHAAGASGIEERAGPEARIELLIYTPADRAASLRAALAETLGTDAEVCRAEPVADVDWSARWRQGLGAVVVSPRLVVRPGFVTRRARPGEVEVIIDPGQAFGVGGHASTRLALEALDRIARRGVPARVLDVGAGTGVLALAALRLGAARAVALDIDPLAARTTAANARRNGLESRVQVVAGGLAALGPGTFDLVLANLLRSELVALLSQLAARVRPGGAAVLSGLLASEEDAIEPTLRRVGLRPDAVLRRTDAAGEAWVALVTRR